MKWQKFTIDIPHRGKMLFWDSNIDSWFEGTLISDTEFGLVISVFENYVPVDGISHYLLIENP